MPRRQSDPDNYETFTCETCGKKTTKRKRRGKVWKFCSNACAAKHTKTVRHYVVRESDMVLDSSFEMLFAGVAIFLKVSIERVDRSSAIGVDLGDREVVYAPDFHLPALGLWVEVKGHEGDEHHDDRWAAWREQCGPLAILKREDLDELRSLDHDGFLARLTELAGPVEVPVAPAKG